MSKGQAPPPPDYSGMAQSSIESAKIYAGVSKDQLDWAKQQYADQAPYTKQFMDMMQTDAKRSGQIQQGQWDNSQKAQKFYEDTYQPVEKSLASQAQGFNSPERTAQRSAAAQGDVAAAYTGQRNAALQTLEGYNIDPSQTRYGALDLGARISQAAAQAGAGTTSRNQTEAMGLDMMTSAANMGRGYPGAVTNSANSATNAGNGAAGQGGAGVNAGLNTSNTYGNMMGNPTAWAGAANSATAMGINAQNTGFQNQMAGFNANSAIAQNQASGVGGLIGAGIGVAAIAV